MIVLQPITIKFEHTEEFDIEAYLEWCMDCGIQPSQKHYKKWAVDCLYDSLTDNIDTDEFQFIYDDPQEIEYSENEEDEEYSENEEDEVEGTFSYASYVNDLTEEELQEFHYLCENDKMVLSPVHCKDNIITMNSCDNPKISYGVIVGEGGKILTIKKSINSYYMFCYLKELKDT
jgi:DNA mismatch repair ATPase MutL